MTDEGIHHVISDLVPVVVVVSMVVASAYVIKLIVGAIRNRSLLKAQTDFHNKMLEKFSSADEFTNYLQSDAGKSFFEKLTVEPAKPLSKILGSIQKGAILTLLGIAFLFFGNIVDLSPDGKTVSLFITTIATATGIGFIISAIVSYRLAKSWGLISSENTAIATQSNTVAP